MRRLILLLTSVLAVTPCAAHADLLGDTLTVEIYSLGDPDIAPVGRGPQIVVPGGGGNSNTFFSYYVTPNQIIFTALQDFNGYLTPPIAFEFDDISRDPMFRGWGQQPPSQAPSILAYASGGYDSSSSVTIGLSNVFGGIGYPVKAGDQTVINLYFAEDTSPVPEPASLALLASGLFGGAVELFRRRRA